MQSRVAGEITPLTGLRGAAAFVIMVYHFGGPPQLLDIKTHFALRCGYLAVDFFYVLSGFVLAYAYGESLRYDVTLQKYGRFILKRVARLYPAYIIVMALFFLKMAFNYAGQNPLAAYRPFDVIGNLLMMTGWGLNVRPIIGDSWSVSAELVCYAIFPVLLPVVFTRSVLWRIIAIALVLCGLLSVYTLGHGAAGPLDVVMQDSFYALLRCVCGFTIGLLTYRTWLNLPTRKFFGRDIVCILLLVAFGTLSLVSRQDLVLYLCIFPIVLTLAADSSVGRVLFGSAPIVFIGEISYSLYLVHGIFVPVAVRSAHILQAHFGRHSFYLMTAPVGMVGAILLAWLSYRLIEIPGKELIMRTISRPERAIG